MDPGTAEILFVAIVFGTLAVIVRTFAEHWTRRRLIDARPEEELLVMLLSHEREQRRDANLRAALVAISLGASLLAASILHLGAQSTIGLAALLIGVALIIQRRVSANGAER